MAGTIAPAADEPGDAIEVFRAAAEAARQTADAAVPGNALAMTSSPEDAAAVKVRLAGAHKEIALAKKTALEAQKAAKELIEQKKRELEQMMRDANALLEPLQKQMDRLQDGIGAVNLYLGRDEEIIPVREGERAPSDEVVLIRQTTLHMDEETAFLADEGGMDFSNIGDFIQWLQDDQTHVDQIIPEMKGVVALQPRKRWKDYTGDAFVDARLNEANRETFWLIRNGENLWLTTAPFSVGAHAVPRADLFTDMFVETVGGERRPMQPGSSAWIRAEEAADQLTRHYMKVALLLQGLVDRTKVFHPLPASGLSFIDQSAYDRGVVRVITDDENVLAAVRQPFDEWLKERTANLDTGMRVVGSFGWGRGFRLYDDKKNYEHANVHPRGAQPADGIYTIKRINDDYFDFSFTFDREDEVYDRYRGYSKAKRKATGKFSAGDKFVLPLDNVTIEEMEEYLAARSERKHYQVMFPLLRAAIAFKRQELTDEQPFRDALVAVLAQTAGYDDLDGVGRTADDLIRWYKTANKWHRPLNADDAKASRLILAEHKRRQTPTSEATLSAIRGTAPDAIVIARRTNDYIAVVPEVRRYAEPAAPENVWVTIITFDGAGKEKNRNSWQQLTRAQVAKWSILHTTDAWSSWMLDPNKETRLTDDDIDLFIDTILHRPETLRGDRKGRYSSDANEHTPFRVLYTERGKDGDRDAIWATMHLASDDGKHYERNARAFRTPTGVEFIIGTEQQEYTSNTQHRLSWRINTWGDIRPDHVVWQDDEVEAQLAATITERAARREAARERSNAAWNLATAVREQWSEHAWERLRARYIEDFGDDELWDEHKKTLREPAYPHWKSNFGSSTDFLSVLTRRLLEAGIDPAGMTVVEAAAAAPGDPIDIPEDSLALRYPPHPDPAA
ncbi:hypothetical protein [Curtobacterium sp. MCSS17_016]|uniref:hypothetical protein n=1 Tax=Curtobacterium sp. MCSS17_016 TaxID=2175644 RepID=UPI000DA8F739|nr:hypothetical protein [Curtobacterium sp. MCSS17_016]WIE81153.1 hypothetical protein DEJ19_018140 [Curtobacterium sp. MCSS17_016]